MTVIETAKVTSKGQITIPNQIRKLLHLEIGETIAFGLTKDGVVLTPCKIEAKSPYTIKEWQKIEKLAAENGKSFVEESKAKAYLDDL